jgi:predicted TIM-barrel fold metal-dependent hydrolase
MPDWSNRSLYAGQNLQDYMMHHVLRRLNEKGMVIQIHTGLLEGIGNYIENSNPSLLSNLFLEYENVKFDIFHIGYPFEKTLTALAKMFPNVFIDMCWAHVISPPACIRILKEWLETVTLNKICAFGGDYRIVDAIYGHLQIARRNVCRALADKISEGLFDLEEGKRVLSQLFYGNPKKLFGLKDL